jgi:hypothetical protein
MVRCSTVGGKAVADSGGGSAALPPSPLHAILESRTLPMLAVSSAVQGAQAAGPLATGREVARG